MEYNISPSLKRSNTPTLYERDFPSEVVSVGSLQSLVQREKEEVRSELRHKNDTYCSPLTKFRRMNGNSRSSLSDNDDSDQLSFMPRRVLRSENIGEDNGNDSNNSSYNNDENNDDDTNYNKINNNNNNSRLVRVYSENERANFNDITGARMYDDLKYRPVHYSNDSSESTIQVTQKPIPINVGNGINDNNYRQPRSVQAAKRRFSSGESPSTIGWMKRNRVPDGSLINGMQDEYIPDFDFADVVTQWQNSDNNTPLLSRFNTWDSDYFGRSSKESLLKLDDLHAQVEPIPLPKRRDEKGAASRAPSTSTLFSPSSLNVASTHHIDTFQHDVDKILKSIPSDFINLPFSQRKRILQEINPEYDYKTIMNLLKRDKLSRSNSIRSARSRHGSVASKFLNSFTPSSNISNDKGALVLGHRLGNVIGFGAWGMIRECTSTPEDSTSTAACKAMKIIKFKHNEKVKKQVLREISIWSKLSHPNILPLNSWKVDEDSIAYCLTDKIDHGTLYDLVTSWDSSSHSKIDLRERCLSTAALALQLVDAMQYMHSNYIIHGDIKLENCLLEKFAENYQSWKVILCDFGMSHYYGHFKDHSMNENIEFKSALDGSVINVNRRPSIPRSSSSSSNTSFQPHSRLKQMISSKNLVHDDTPLGITSLPKNYGPSLTSVTTPKNDSNLKLKPESLDHLNDEASRIGSLPYAAPELLEPRPPPFGPGADIWAFGVLMYTMVTGKLPFKHDYEPRLRAIITSGKYDLDTLKNVCSCNMSDNLSPGKNIYFHGLYNAIRGCLTKDMTKRWELDMVKVALQSHF